MHNDEFLPRLVLPAGYHGMLRRWLAEIEAADSAVNCLIAQARAEGMAQALDSSRIVRLYQLVVDTATARLAVLQREGGK